MVMRWLGMRSAKRSNQKAEMRVRISPLKGTSSGRMKSKALIRSLATISRLSPQS